MPFEVSNDADAIARRRDAGDLGVLEESHVARPQDVDDRVDVTARVDRAVARHDQAGADVIGDGRREPADLVAVDDPVGDARTELDHRLQCLEVMLGLGDVVVGDEELAAERDGRALGRQALEDRRAVAVELGQRGAARLVPRCRAVAGERQQPRRHPRYCLRKDAQRARRIAQRLQRVADRAGRGQRLDDGRAHESGVAACRAAAERGVVDDGDLGARLGEEQRRRQADEPAADDDDRLAHDVLQDSGDRGRALGDRQVLHGKAHALEQRDLVG